MSDFLTVEDVNSVLMEYGNSNIFHEINTANITSEYDFDSIKYDFCVVEREKTNTNEYTFKFEIINSAWAGGYYILDNSDSYVDDATVTYDSETKILTVVTDNPSIKLYLYLFAMRDLSKQAFNLKRYDWKIIGNSYIQVVPAGNQYNPLFKNLPIYVEVLNPDFEVANIKITNSARTFDCNVELIEDNRYALIPYQNLIMQDNPPMNYYAIYPQNDTQYLFVGYTVIKAPIPLSLNKSNLVKGKVNTLGLNFIYPFTGINSIPVIYYDNKEVYCDLDTHEVELDLTNKMNEDSIDLLVRLLPQNQWYGWEYKFTVPLVYYSVSSYADLVSECGDGGTTILELAGNITLSNNISITHDIKIDGKGKTINLNSHGFVLKEGVTVTLENILFTNGDTALTQEKNTDLTLENCSFTNCVSSNYNNLGSCVYCEIDTESLSNPEDFITVIKNCTFKNNHSCILHGGKLTVTHSKYHNTDTTYINKHNVAFLYQTDGRATLKNNIFDIDYGTDYSLCTGEKNIGLAQALIQCGLTSRINGADSTMLLEDNKLPFSDNVYQNASHVFAKYYYPQAETCVFTSPVLDKEDKAVCYCVTGENWIFKQNVQVTRASWDTQNEIRKIEWED